MKKFNGVEILEAAELPPGIAGELRNREISAACVAALARGGVPTYEFQPRLHKKNGATVVTVRRRRRQAPYRNPRAAIAEPSTPDVQPSTFP